MAQPLGVLTVEVNGDTHVIELKKIDFVRAEQMLQRSVSRMDTLTDIYAIAWTKLRRTDVAGIPDTFDGFLDLEPDVEAAFADGEDAGGKDSGPAVPTGQ
jgi:hypothetical protein